MVRRTRRTIPAGEGPAEKKKETKTLDPSAVNRTNFLNALNKIKPGIDSSNAIVEGADLVLFDENRLVSFNDEVAVSFPFQIGLCGGVHAKELFKLLQKMKEEDIEHFEEEGQFMLKCGTTEAGFNMAAEISIPDLGLDEVKEWISLPEDFCNAIGFSLFSASTDIAQGILTCIKVENNSVISCDNFRLTKYEMSDALSTEEIIFIPYASAKEMISYLPIEMAISESWLHFKNKDDVIFSLRPMEGDYPDIVPLLEVEGEVIGLPKGLKETLERAEILADEDTSGYMMVAIEISKDKIICHGQGPSGWIKETVKINYKGKELKILVAPALLSQILDRVQEVTIGDRMLFQSEKFKHVVALLE